MAFNDTIGYNDYIHTNTFLSNFALSYKLANPIADFVAPPFLVKRPADKYAIYNKSINRVYQNQVKDTEEAKEITYNVTQGTYNCQEYSLAKGVLWRAKRNTDNVFNLDFDAVRFLKRAQAIAREYRVAQIAGSSSIVTQGKDASNAWGTTAGTPITDLLTGQATVVQATSYTPNRVTIPVPTALKMIQTTEWRDYFKFNTSGYSGGLWSASDGLKNIGLDPMQTAVMGTNGPEIQGSNPGMEIIWGTNVVMFYCEPNPTLETRTFMYSPYTLRDLIETIPQRSFRRDLHVIYEEISELLVDAQCAYLIRNTI